MLLVLGATTGNLPHDGLTTVTLLGVMLMVRHYPNLSYLGHFDQDVNKVVSTWMSVSLLCETLHRICNNYIDKSSEEGERVRRASNITSGELPVRMRPQCRSGHVRYHQKRRFSCCNLS